MRNPNFDGAGEWGRLRSLIPFAAAILLCLFVASCTTRKSQRNTWVSTTEPLHAAREEVQIRMEKIPSGLRESPYIGIRAESEKGSFLLLVDTGTSLTLLRESRRKELKLTRHTRAFLDSTPDVPREIFLTSSLRAGPFEFTNEAVAFLPDDQIDSLTKNSGQRIDGILGATLLKRGEIEFRGSEGVLTIRPFDRSILEGDDGTVDLIFIPDSNTYAVHLAAENLGGCRLLFDTGTNVDLVLDEQRPLGRRIKQTQQLGVWTYESVHGAHEVAVHRLPFALSGPGVVFPSDARVFVDARRQGPLDGVIGVPLIWKTPVVILNRQREAALFGGTPP